MNELEGQIRMLLANGRAEDIDADQILALCDELAASRTIYQSAVKGRQDMRDALRSERDETKALRAPSATEAGVRVPREPTPEMTQAGWEAWAEEDHGKNASVIHHIYSAMLAAASPAKQPTKE